MKKMHMTDTEIKMLPGGGVVLTGEATELYRAMVLDAALGLLKRGVTPTKGLTGKQALAMVQRYTGKQYKRGQFDVARADLKVWIETMKSSIPVSKE